LCVDSLHMQLKQISAMVGVGKEKHYTPHVTASNVAVDVWMGRG